MVQFICRWFPPAQLECFRPSGIWSRRFSPLCRCTPADCSRFCVSVTETSTARSSTGRSSLSRIWLGCCAWVSSSVTIDAAIGWHAVFVLCSTVWVATISQLGASPFWYTWDLRCRHLGFDMQCAVLGCRDLDRGNCANWIMPYLLVLIPLSAVILVRRTSQGHLFLGSVKSIERSDVFPHLSSFSLALLR